MTKLLYCEQCQTITSLMTRANAPVKCGCGRHHAWWANPSTGDVRVYDAQSVKHGEHVNGTPHRPAAYFIGIHNSLLDDGSAVTTKEFVDGVLRRTPEYYIFKEARSLIVKFRPGISGDSRWSATLPGM